MYEGYQNINFFGQFTRAFRERSLRRNSYYKNEDESFFFWLLDDWRWVISTELFNDETVVAVSTSGFLSSNWHVLSKTNQKAFCYKSFKVFLNHVFTINFESK